MINRAVTLCPYERGSNTGGPPGFIETNYRGHKVPNCDFVYADDFLHSNKQLFMSTLKSFLYNIVGDIRTQVAKPVPSGSYHYVQYIGLRCRALYAKSRAKEYRVCIFHDVFSLYFCIPLIPHTQHVVLYPHMPELPYEEMVTFGAPPDSLFVSWVKNIVTPKCFNIAKSIFLPNSGVLSIYNSVVSPKNQVFFISSGSALKEVTSPISLDPSLCTFLYIGRRDYIKGFDLVIEAFNKAYMQNSRIRLLLAGSGILCDDPGVIDLQVTARPHLWMRSVDCVVNANRQSYFDRSIIEGLSIGARLLIACTHGHSELLGASPGIMGMPYASTELLLDAFLLIEKNGFPENARVANQKLYSDRYSDHCHRTELEKTLSVILDE
jgi:glycosyltransferase involved in cell wall biosynthesis